MAWGLQTQARFFVLHSIIDSCQILSFPFFHFVILVILGPGWGILQTGQMAGPFLQKRLNIQQDRRRRYENEIAWGRKTQRIFFVR